MFLLIYICDSCIKRSITIHYDAHQTDWEHQRHPDQVRTGKNVYGREEKNKEVKGARRQLLNFHKYDFTYGNMSSF